MSTAPQPLTPAMQAAPSATLPMISPDGQIGDIPVDQAEKAAASGFKHAVDMVSPDGKTGTIPTEQAEAAQKSGFRIAHPPNATQIQPTEEKSAGDVADASPVMRPEQMQNAASVAGALATIPAATASTVPAGAMAEELTGGLKILRDQTTGQFVKAGPSLVGKIPGILKSTFDWANANPIKAYAIYQIAREAGIGDGGLKKIFHLVSGAAEAP